MPPQLTLLNAVSTFSFARDENCTTALVKTDSGQVAPYGLYMVTMTYRNKTHIAYVLAESSKGAISQVDQLPMDPEPHILDGQMAIESGEMTATAVRIPLHIRGWGLQTF